MKHIFTSFLCSACLLASLATTLSACGAARKRQDSAAAPATAARYGYRIVEKYAHDPEAFTQGLFWHDGNLVESTGNYGESTLRRVDLASGEVLKSVALGDDFFGEGAARLGDRIFVLTWLEGKCFVYDDNFVRTGEFAYQGQGWGLTTDGSVLYMSDGTANIAVRRASDFAVERNIIVQRDGRNVQFINELEWIDGRIWANVYMSNEIIVIDPASGRVEATIDLAGIESNIKITPSTDVLNGIAWDGKRIFVTGKNWDQLFEIEIVK